MSSEKWAFFRAFLRAPRVVASVIPSSRALERRVVAAAEADTARVVVELGPGTGGVTKALLAGMRPGATLLAIERTPQFIDRLAAIGDPRFDVVNACASTLADELHGRGLPPADAIVSGIPFSTIPEALARQIIAAVDRSLAPGGRFVAYQVVAAVARFASPVLGDPQVRCELRSIPPTRVFTWRKPE